MIMLPSAVLMKRSILQRFPQVALTCLAFLSWFSGAVMTQHRTRTFSDILLAFKSSPTMWTQQISYDEINSSVQFLIIMFVNHLMFVTLMSPFFWAMHSDVACKCFSVRSRFARYRSMCIIVITLKAIYYCIADLNGSVKSEVNYSRSFYFLWFRLSIFLSIYDLPHIMILHRTKFCNT